MSEQPRKRCYNCKHGGDMFKLDKMPHLHCEHPKWTPETALSQYDTLCEWWSSCGDWESNQLTEKQHEKIT